MLADELRDLFLTSGLTDDQRAELLAAGEEIHFDDDEVLFVEGASADYLWILLDGQIELTRHSGGETFVLATMSTPGQWAGGLRAWGDTAEHAGYRATGRGVGGGRCLRVPSDDLRRLVGAWFPFGLHMTVGIFQTIRGIDALVRQRERLVALGTLAAGMAHEINNPAAASLHAVAAMRTTCEVMVSSLTRLARSGVSADQFVALEQLRAETLTAVPPQGGALAVAECEEAVGEWLSARGVADAWQVAAVLAAAGVDRSWCERVERAVGVEALGGALQWTASNLSARALLDELEDATTRISQLVGAVKSYSQMDRASLQRVDVHDGIESTLVMMGHRLHDIDVQREFADDVPELDAYAGELNQVWTNLIDNAIDAMDGQGTLRVATRRDGPDLVVDIVDTGHGMPTEVLDRAFEPFFTTKDIGKGTGLGLDISRRIVGERHGGEISFDSSPSGTTVRVRIPLTRQS